MIVRRHEVRGQGSHLILVRQLDHSALSGEFARNWGREPFARPTPLDSVVLASARHDEGWREQDEQPLYDAQAKTPAHFRTLDVRTHIPFYREGIRRIVALDPYAGLLVSMHGSGIYQDRYGAGPIRMTTQTDEVRVIMDTFVDEQEALQTDLKRRLWARAGRRRTFERTVWVHYELLQVWDLLSLFICIDRDRTPTQRIGPVPTTVEGGDLELELTADEDDTVRVTPWPFTLATLEAVVPARTIPDRTYESQQDLRQTLDEALDASIRCRLVPG